MKVRNRYRKRALGSKWIVREWRQKMYRLLVADDEMIERAVLVQLLEEELGDQCRIFQAENGREALEVYEKEKIQIAVLDIEMPGITGIEAAQRIREKDKDCCIIFLTAFDEFSYAKRAIVIRALDYLLKPCDEEELTAVMEEAMRLTDKAVENKKNSSGSGEEKTEAEKEAEKRKEQWPWNPDAEPPKDPETERVNQVAEKIRTYIRENYMNEISMQDAARQFNYSDAYFCKLFKQCFDQNFTTYLTNFRINEAKRLLKDRNISVKDAGMKVGYYDSNYFAKVFKRVTGMIPSEYRETD